MSLIKASTSSAQVTRWRPAPGLPDASSPPPTDPFAAERAQLKAEISRLVAERDGLDARIAALQTEASEAVAKAETAAFSRGREAAATHAAESLARLERSLEQALSQVAADEGAVEQLALKLARTALGKVLGAPDEPARLVESLIRRQLADVLSELLLRIEVSAVDFPDAESLSGLAVAVGKERVQIAASPALSSGDCSFKLRLGELEVGLPEQWRRLAGLFDAMAQEPAP